MASSQVLSTKSQQLWHYIHAGNQVGPITFTDLQRLATLGDLDRSDVVWSEGMADWEPADSVAELFETTGNQPPAVNIRMREKQTFLIELTSYEILSQDTWRVSYTKNLPDISSERLLEEYKKELPRFQMPVDIDLIEVITPESNQPEKRVRIKHKNSPYDLLHIIIGLQDFGTFVYAQRWNCLIKEPEKLEPKKARRRLKEVGSVVISMLAAGAGIVLGLCVSVWLIGSELCFLPLVMSLVLGFVVFFKWQSSQQAKIYNTEAKTYNTRIDNEWNNRFNRYMDEFVEYWSALDKAFLSQFDTTLFRLRDSAGVVTGIVLNNIYPQAQIGDAEKTINREDEARNQLKKMMQKHKETGQLKT